MKIIDTKIPFSVKKKGTSNEELASQLAQKAAKTDLDTQKSRIDSLIALPEGATTNDARLEDIAVGVDGAIYDSPGTAVRKIDRRTSEIVDRDDQDDTFYITDANGNVLVKASADGVEVAGIGNLNKLPTFDNIPDGIMSGRKTDEFYITDGSGNVIFKANKDGIAASKFLSAPENPYKGGKLISIGDSMTAQTNISNVANLWQSLIASWLGMVYDHTLTISGANGHAPMAIGGTAILPTRSDSIYIRALDAQYYSPDVIILYAGQNDQITPVGKVDADGIIDTGFLGTINDAPLKVTSPIGYQPSFYSNYMGMVENLLTQNPNARLFLVTLMPSKIVVGGTISDGRTITSQMVTNIDAVRFAKVKAVRDIADKYNLPVIDLWKNSGLTHFNNTGFYIDGDTQVHHNESGGYRIAECMFRAMN